MYATLLLLHILAATVWTGGHLVLALTVLPRVLKERAPTELLRFESAYERIGLPISRLIAVKILLLVVTVAFAVDARVRIIPRLSEKTLTALAWHIIPVTIVSVLFVVVGVSFRTGGFD
jgi:putative copper export protein